MRLLLERGADKQALDPGCSTPLHLAVEAGHLGSVRAYVKTLYHASCWALLCMCVWYLFCSFWRGGCLLCVFFRWCVCVCVCVTMSSLIDAGVMLEAPDQIGDTALHTAAYAYVDSSVHFFLSTPGFLL